MSLGGRSAGLSSTHYQPHWRGRGLHVTCRHRLYFYHLVLHRKTAWCQMETCTNWTNLTSNLTTRHQIGRLQPRNLCSTQAFRFTRSEDITHPLSAKGLRRQLKPTSLAFRCKRGSKPIFKIWIMKILGKKIFGISDPAGLPGIPSPAPFW